MGLGVSNSEKKPVATVTVGSVTVTKPVDATCESAEQGQLELVPTEGVEPTHPHGY